MFKAKEVQKPVNKFIRKPVYNKIGVRWIENADVKKSSSNNAQEVLIIQHIY